jgi:hypothetical protein
MSHRLIAHNEDLRRLRDEGYNISIRGGFLVMMDVPYVAPGGRVARGVLADPLQLSGDETNRPGSHTMMWVGEEPCDASGRPLPLFSGSDGHADIDAALVANHYFSAKTNPPDVDYFSKFTRYVGLITPHAQRLDVTTTAATFPLITDDDGDSVFTYTDTASSRAQITAVAERLKDERVAIVGLGGTGSYVLDMVSKTAVTAIHLFDSDRFQQHNAFRAPGAATLSELQARPTKVDYHRSRYSAMRRAIVAHPIDITAENAAFELRDATFAFLATSGGGKQELVRVLEGMRLPFVDVGMDVQDVDGALTGVLRVTTSTPEKRDHVWAKKRIPFGSETDHDEYAQNIQIAELNALNAALAVIRWKKLRGVYCETQHEHYSRFSIDDNEILNEDQA